MKPGAGRGPKILPEPPTESEGLLCPGVSRIGRVRPLQRKGVFRGTREVVRGCEALDKRGGTARVFKVAPVPAVETYHGTSLPQEGGSFHMERCEA